MQVISIVFILSVGKKRNRGEPLKFLVMAKVKNDVVRDINKGCKMKEIIEAIRLKYSSKDAVFKALLWLVWFKVKKALGYLLRAIVIILSLMVYAPELILFTIIFVIAVILSPIWYPLMMKCAPERAASMIVGEIKDSGCGFIGGVKFFRDLPKLYVFCIPMNFVWKFLWSFMPMQKRGYYLDAAMIDISTLSSKEQIDYFDLKNKENKKSVIQRMSSEAIEGLWKRGNYADRVCILREYDLKEDWTKSLFDGTEEMLELLKKYCSMNRVLNVNSQKFLVKKLASETDVERAYEALYYCCANSEQRLDNATLLDMVSLGSYEAYKLLTFYWSRFTFGGVVLWALFEAATSHEAESNEQAFELLLRVVRRDGVTTEQAEYFYEHCEDVQHEKKFDNVLKIRRDLNQVGFSCASDENRKSWEQYCTVTKVLSYEAEVLMQEWQYDIYISTRHSLSKEALYELLVKKLQKDQRSYFEKVLREEGTLQNLSDQALKLIALVDWKRELLLKLACEDKAKLGETL